MGRHGIDENYDGPVPIEFWDRIRENAISGKRGQAFLRELRDTLDAMPVKELAAWQWVDDDGCACALAAVERRRDGLRFEENRWPGCEVAWHRAAEVLGITPTLASAIMYETDEFGAADESKARRWHRIRSWVAMQLGELWPPAPVAQPTGGQ
jgi:hypothetical protein